MFCHHYSHLLNRLSKATLLYSLWLIFNIILGSSSIHLEILMILALLFTYTPFLHFLNLCHGNFEYQS